MEFCNFSKMGLQHGRTENLSKVAAFSTQTEVLTKKNRNYYSGNTTYQKWLFQNPFFVRTVHLPIFY